MEEKFYVELYRRGNYYCDPEYLAKEFNENVLEKTIKELLMVTIKEYNTSFCDLIKKGIESETMLFSGFDDNNGSRIICSLDEKLNQYPSLIKKSHGGASYISLEINYK